MKEFKEIERKEKKKLNVKQTGEKISNIDV